MEIFNLLSASGLTSVDYNSNTIICNSRTTMNSMLPKTLASQKLPPRDQQTFYTIVSLIKRASGRFLSS